jgi:hypothetical protein
MRVPEPREPMAMTVWTAARAAVACAGVLVVALAFVASYVGALHDPKPHGIPVAAAVPARVRAQLAAGGALRVVPVRTKAEALRKIDRREVYGAIGATAAGRTEVVVAPAAGAGVAEALTRLAARLHARVRVVHPLPATDGRGLSPFYLVVGWTVGGYLCATFLGLLFGTQLRSGVRVAWRLLAVAGLAVALGFSSVAVVRAFGPLHHSYAAIAGFGILTAFAVGAATAAFQATIGIAGTGVAILLFVVLGNPASGGVYSRPLLPAFWRWFEPGLPTGAAVDAVRNLAYFPAAPLGLDALTLALWAAAGSAAAVVAGAVRRRADAAGMRAGRSET